MLSATNTPKKKVHFRRRAKIKPLTKVELFKKMLANQKIIREAIQNGTSLEQLEKEHGFTFARLSHITTK